MGTPIGNAADITLRALEVLAGVDVIACEDTRVTGRLMARYGIATPLVAYHEHNAERVRPRLLRRLASGEAVALVSDAGMPLLSDPGYKLVRACIEQGIPLTLAPGPSAVTAAVALSGLPPDRFLFAGFAPPRKAARRRALTELASVPASLVFFESPRRLAAALADMTEVLGPREAAVAREMTKLYEEVRRAPLPELAEHYRRAGAPKGEVAVVVAPPPRQPAVDTAGPDGTDAAAELDRRLERALARASLRDAVDEVTAATGLARRRVYARALALAEGRRPRKGTR